MPLCKKLYVSNLDYKITQPDLEQMFVPYGAVISVQLIMDRESGRSKGFAFVEMGSADEAQAAIAGLNGSSVEGRSLSVDEARSQLPRHGGSKRS